MDDRAPREHALNAPLRGPGLSLPRVSDTVWFQDIQPQPPGWWGALAGEYVVPMPTYPAFLEMMRDAVKALALSTAGPPDAPVVVGLWPDHVGLAMGGPFARCPLHECTEVWRLSTDDLARILLHVLFHGKRCSVLTAADVPPCFWRLVAHGTRIVEGLTEPVGGIDVTWSALPNNTTPETDEQSALRTRERRSLIFLFLVCKRWVNHNSYRCHLRGVWAQFLRILRHHMHFEPRKAKDVLGNVATLIIDTHHDFFGRLASEVRDTANFLRDRLVEGRRPSPPSSNPLVALWQSAGNLASFGSRLLIAPFTLRFLPSVSTSRVVVMDRLLRSLQVRLSLSLCVCLYLSAGVLCAQFEAVAHAQELGDENWERIEGASLLDWQLSPYEGGTAFCTNDPFNDAPTLWVCWPKNRRHAKLVGWLRLVAQGKAPQPVLPLAPAVTRALLQCQTPQEAVALLLPVAALFDRRPPPAPLEWLKQALEPLLSGAICLPLARLVFRLAGVHSVRIKALSTLLPLLPNVAKWLAKLAQTFNASGEDFVNVPEEHVLGFVAQLCTATDRAAVGTWVEQHWRTIAHTAAHPLAPPATSAHCSDPELLAFWRSLPHCPPLLQLLLAKQHRVRQAALAALQTLAQSFQCEALSQWCPSEAANSDGTLEVPLSVARAFLSAVAALPEATQASIVPALLRHWRTESTQPEVDRREVIPSSMNPGSRWEKGASSNAGGWNPQTAFVTLEALECAARGETCRWTGLDLDTVLRVSAWPIVRQGWSFKTLDDTLPLLVDSNAEPVSSPFFREVARQRVPLPSLRLNPVEPHASGSGSMEVEAALHTAY